MGERSLTGSELRKDAECSALFQPGQHSCGPFVVGEVVIESLQLMGDPARVVAEQSTKPSLESAACARSR